MQRTLCILLSLAAFLYSFIRSNILPMVIYLISPPLDRILTANRNSPAVEDSDVDQMFLEIEKNRDNEKAWKALHHYSSIPDGGGRMLFFRACFKILEKDNLIFFNRYLKGDEQAIFRMIDALSYDFSAFGDEKFEVFDEIYKKFLRQYLSLYLIKTKSYINALLILIKYQEKNILSGGKDILRKTYDYYEAIEYHQD